MIFWLGLSSCTSAPKADGTICIVDSKQDGWQCIDPDKNSVFRPLDQGTDEECISPAETEKFLKECRMNQLAAVTLCSYLASSKKFDCVHPDSHHSEKKLLEMDNFFCMKKKSMDRLKDRCRYGTFRIEAKE